MATLERKVPSPNTFLYKPWSAFIEAVKLQNSDIAHVEDTEKDIANGREARKLNREDMHLYGQYPAYDELCLVVCNICSQVVKPEGFLSHYERRHAPSCDSRPPLTQRPKVSHSSPPQPRPFRPPRDNQHTSFSRTPHTVYPPKGARTKPCVSVPVVSLEKMSCLGRVDGAHVRLSYPSSSSSSSPAAAASSVRPPPHKPPQERVLNGRGPSAPGPAPDRRPSPSPSTLDKRPSPAPSPSPTTLDRRPAPSPSSSLDRPPTAPPPLQDRKHQNGTKGTKPYKRVSGRVFDPNKHCGVLDPESKKPCTRSLTCKTHSLTHRRAVPGRGKQFDSLLAEHKGRHLREQPGSHAHPSRPAQSHEPASSSTSTDCLDGRTTSSLKSRLATAHIPRPPGGWSSVGPPPDSTPPCPAPGGGDRLSGEEGEGETPEDLDCPYSSHHPRPMACCTFGGRLMGRGCYVFDRRWDRVRLALRCMVEKHVNAQMWRKIPLAAESRTSYPASQPAPLPLAPPSPASLPPPLLPSPALTSATNSVSMVTYSTAFPRVGGGGGVFSIVDSASLLPPVPALAPLFPSQSRPPRSRPGKPPKACEPLSRGGGGGAAGGGATGGGGAVGGVTGSKKRKSPLSSSSYTGPHRGSTTPPPNSHQPGPTPSSNGTSPLCAKTPPPGPGLPRPLPFSGDHALFARADARKRKSSSPVGRPGKTPKTAGLSGLYRPPGPEPHPALSRQPKVHH